MKADRNKTIDITVEEGKKYLERCIRVSGNTTLDAALDKTILGDTFETLKLHRHNLNAYMI